MPSTLTVTAGQYSDKGRKEINQDFHGLIIPPEPQLGGKGVAIALADGISSSAVSQVAAQFAVTGFLDDYYCTSEAWSVQTSAQRVLAAVNSWLHAQTRRGAHPYDADRGYVCTFSAVVVKSRTAHVFHVGDARVYRLRGHALEQLTTDHRVWVSREQSYLGRALGINPRVEIDHHALDVDAGDVFFLATDGVYEYLDAAQIIATIRAANADADPHALDAAARTLVEQAYARGSTDNLTAQLLRIDTLPDGEASEMQRQLATLPPAPLLEPRMQFEGYRIMQTLHASSRSHVYLAEDIESGTTVALKVPSTDLRANAAYLEGFLMEEWVARRINSAHVLKPHTPTRARKYLYTATEYIAGQSLRQWMTDHPKPALEEVRTIVEQVARGLRAFHRLEMLHQDIRPENILIARNGTVKIIDFGAVRVAGLAEIESSIERSPIPGTPQYAAPEYFVGATGTQRSDLFSLAVLTYHMLTGDLPYGVDVAKTKSRAEQYKLHYASALEKRRDLPAWIDGALKKALHPDPLKRHADLAEFAHELRHPNPAYLARARPPLIERNPVQFWKALCGVLTVIIILLLMQHLR